MRWVYLGQDITEARKLAVDDTVLCSAEMMGDAMRDAAFACAAEFLKAKTGG